MSNKNHPFAKNRLPVILWCCFIFFLSSIPGRDFPQVRLFPNADKVVHAGLYFVFCWLAHRAFRSTSNKAVAELSLYLALVAAVVYGCSDEFHQLYVMGRTADIFDMLADAFGGLLYVAFFMVVVRPRIKTRSGLTAL